MTAFKTLMQREWMQHRLGWLLLAGVPLLLAVALLGFGQIEIDAADVDSAGTALPALVAMVTILATTALLFTIGAATSLFLVSGLPRRDHADRSHEFWLSLPTGHAPSLAAPLLMHLLVVPAAAIVVGVVGGVALSALSVGRVAGLGEWFALPWASLLPAVLAGAARFLVGLPLAVLWLLPLILLVMLSTAVLRRWGLVVVALALGIGHAVLSQGYGIPVIGHTLGTLFGQAQRALFTGGGMPKVSGGEEAAGMMQAIPGWMLADLGRALGELASPAMVGVLLASAAGFALLVQWRRRSG